METLYQQLSGTSTSPKQSVVRIGTTTTLAEEGGKEIEIPIYTVTLGTQTMELLPFKNWTQLDVHKWVVQGKLPASPAGLEVTFDHVKIAGETVLSKDPEGCAKLEHAFNEWLALERGTLELAQKKLHSKPTATVPAAKRHEAQPLHYQVQLDQERQVHIQCLQGKEVLASIGLNLPGFNSLADQGLLRKPRSLKVGALHDWVELDGVLYSFEKGNNDAAQLERILNERYLSNVALGQGKDVVVFPNAASSTGFDIQFTALLGGVPDNRRRPLNEDSLDLLQDPTRCGLLHKGLVIKLTRPSLIFKQKTPDGGERYLDKTPENAVIVKGDNGSQKIIDLSQPVNYLRLSAVELTAVFNHPSINKHVKLTTGTSGEQGHANISPLEVVAPTNPSAEGTATASILRDNDQRSAEADSGPSTKPKPTLVPWEKLPTATVVPVSTVAASRIDFKDSGAAVTASDPEHERKLKSAAPAVESTPPESLPNAWLEPILSQPPIRFDWFSCLIYDKMAEHFGNSHQGQVGPMSCWAVALGETEDIGDSAFRGIFLTEKHGLGFLNHGHMARFYKGVAFIGTQDSALEGIGINLVAVGIDVDQRIVFIVAVDYLAKFDVPERALKEELARLIESGARVLSVIEALGSTVALEVVWTVPAEQQNPMDPQALESVPALGAEPLEKSHPDERQISVD
jgi:hypothetical protein